MKRLATLITLIATCLWAPNIAALEVVTTLPDLAAIAEAVGGDAVDATALARPTEDPHYVDPRPNLIIALNKADVLVSVGLELEDGWLEPLTKQARNPAVLVGGTGRLVAAEHVELIDVRGQVDRSEGDVHPGGNPHFYFDPRRAIRIAIAMRDLFSKLEPAQKDLFQKRTRAFVTEAQKLVIAQQNKFSQIPDERRRVVTYHKSLGYLLDWLDLEAVATIEPKPGIPPNPAHVAKVLKMMKAERIDVVVQEEYYPQKTAQTLAKLAKGEVVVVHAGTRFDDGESYLEHIRKMTEELHEALSK